MAWTKVELVAWRNRLGLTRCKRPWQSATSFRTTRAWRAGGGRLEVAPASFATSWSSRGCRAPQRGAPDDTRRASAYLPADPGADGGPTARWKARLGRREGQVTLRILVLGPRIGDGRVRAAWRRGSRRRVLRQRRRFSGSAEPSLARRADHPRCRKLRVQRLARPRRSRRRGTALPIFLVCGKRRGIEDPRGSLTLQALRAVSAIQPRYVVIENVTGLRTSNEGEGLRAVIERLENSGSVSPGESWTRSISSSPNAGAGSGSLLSVLETQSDLKQYSISQKGLAGVRSRAERSGRPLPAGLRKPPEK